MKERPVFLLLLSMGIPMILSMLASSLYNIVDSIFVSRISEDAMTALSLVFPMQNLISAIGVGFGIGVNSAIARSLGAEKEREASQAATQGFALSILHGIIIQVSCLLFIPYFLRFFTGDGAIIEYGLRYASIIFWFSAIVTSAICFEKIFQAVGLMVVSMLSMMAGCVVNIILDPVLIFGLGPFPEMGIEGAAWATGIGQTLSLLLYVLIYLRRPINAKVSLKFLGVRKELWRDMYSVGTAASLNMALPSVLLSSLNAILAPFSQTYVLVLGVYYKLQALLYQTANGLVQGMRPIVAYNYGAKEYGRVQAIYRSSMALIAGMMLFGTALCLAVPEWLIGLFTQNPSTIQIGAGALRIICPGFILSSVSVASSGALEGLGKGRPSFLISLARYVVVILPAAFLLSRSMGPAGVWHAFWITEAVSAAWAFWIYRASAAGTHQGESAQ